MSYKPVIAGLVNVPTGGGGSQTLAQVLAVGNDANALAITNLADIYVGASADDGTGNALQVTGGASIHGSAGVFYIGTSPGGSPTFGSGFAYVGDADGQVTAFYDSGGNGVAQLTTLDGVTAILQAQRPGIAFTNLALNNGGGNVLIGTTTDDATNKLQVSGSIAVGGTQVFDLSGKIYGITPVSDGTYTLGLGVTNNGTITTQNGIITVIQEAL